MDADAQSDLCQSSISTREDSSVWMRCPGHDGVKGNDRADRLAGQACSHSTVELETLPAAVKPRASKLRSPGGERRGKKKRTTIFLERTRRERAILNQTSTGTVLKATMTNVVRNGVERIKGFPSA